MIKRLINWLTGGPAPESPSPARESRRVSAHAALHARATPAPARKPATDISDIGGRFDGHIENVGPGKNVLVRNKYVREDTGTHETLKIVDDTLKEQDEEFGADPYNTGRFDRSKSWDSFRTRK